MKLTMWLKEREQNSRRLAAAKTGNDRAGWIEDADYLQAACAAVEERDRLRAVLAELVALRNLRAGLPPPGSWASVDTAPVHSDCLRREPLAWAAARAALGPNVAIKRLP